MKTEISHFLQKLGVPVEPLEFKDAGVSLCPFLFLDLFPTTILQLILQLILN